MRARANSKGVRYQRSWKHILLNARYQLRFTLFMVGLSIVLMSGLVFGTSWIGQIWPDRLSPQWLTKAASTLRWGGVYDEANEATRVGMNAAIERCVEIPKVVSDDESAAIGPTPMAVTGDNSDAAVGSAAQDVGAATGSGSAATGSGSAAGDADDHHIKVEMTEESMTLVPVVPPDFGDKVVAHWTCMARYWGAVDVLQLGRTRILWVLAASALLLVVGLAIYGLKMTHRVAGPLFKVGLYFAKMRDGRFDKVYNLRKGDQLVEFYEHFKIAHAGIVTRERDDVAQLKAVVAAAEDAGLGDHDATKQLRELIARKEKSLE